jgi:hypothetical protein
VTQVVKLYYPAGHETKETPHSKRILCSGPLSTQADYYIVVSGEVGLKEISYLIRTLELYCGFLRQDEAGDKAETAGD